MYIININSIVHNLTNQNFTCSKLKSKLTQAHIAHIHDIMENIMIVINIIVLYTVNVQ